MVGSHDPKEAVKLGFSGRADDVEADRDIWAAVRQLEIAVVSWADDNERG